MSIYYVHERGAEMPTGEIAMDHYPSVGGTVTLGGTPRRVEIISDRGSEVHVYVAPRTGEES